MKVAILIALLIVTASAETFVTITNPTEGAVLSARDYIVLTYEYSDLPTVEDGLLLYEFFMEYYGVLDNGGVFNMRAEPISVIQFRLGRHDFSLTLAEKTSDRYYTQIRMQNYTDGSELTWKGPMFTLVNSRDPCSPPSECEPGVDIDFSPRNPPEPRLPDGFGPAPTLANPNPDPLPASASSRLRPFWF